MCANDSDTNCPTRLEFEAKTISVTTDELCVLLVSIVHAGLQLTGVDRGLNPAVPEFNLCPQLLMCVL